MNNNVLSEVLFSNVNDVDGYKFGQYLQLDPEVRDTFAYGASRGSNFEGINETVYVGLQYYLKEYLSKPVTMADVEFTSEFCKIYGTAFNYEGWKYIVEHHNGYLPITIKSAPEGSVIPTKNVLYTIHANDPKCAWLPSYIETSIMRALWYPTTVATISYNVKKILFGYLKETSDQMDSLEYGGLCDFGSRAATCREAAMIGGMAHSFIFPSSSDNVTGLLGSMKYYGYIPRKATVNASEHSSTGSWGKEHEYDMFSNMVDKYLDEYKVFAAVGDTYHVDNALRYGWFRSGLLKKIKDKGGCLVFRPDSGTPRKVIERLLTICIEEIENCLGDKIIINSKGYKVLPSYIRFIYGDAMSYITIPELFEHLKTLGWSTENVVCIGMGGKLLQAGLDRDGFKFAQKCSSVLVNEGFRDVFKDPIDDPGKASFKGRITLIKDDHGNYETIRLEDPQERKEELEVVFKNGHIIKEYTHDEIYKRINKEFN